jgi:hypothetical protein
MCSWPPITHTWITTTNIGALPAGLLLLCASDRTSSGHFLSRGQDEVVKRLEQRIADWTKLPVVNGEPFHVRSSSAAAAAVQQQQQGDITAVKAQAAQAPPAGMSSAPGQCAGRHQCHVSMGCMQLQTEQQSQHMRNCCSRGSVNSHATSAATWLLLLQVLHYQEGEQYVEHWDYFHDAVNVQNGGQRVATALIYLSEVDEGVLQQLWPVNCKQQLYW